MKTRVSTALAAGLLPLLASGIISTSLQAQESRMVAPGDVVTVPLRPTPPEGMGGTVSYRIEPASGVRYFTPLDGSTEIEPDFNLPITFVVPREQPAGPMLAARVRFSWPDGTTLSEEMRVRIEALHRLEISLSTPSPMVHPGGVLELAYAVANRGNVTDTVRLGLQGGREAWRVPNLPPRLVLEPGEERSGSMRVHAPEATEIGSSRRLELTATGRGNASGAHVILHIVEDAGWLAGVEHVPATLFVGTHSGGNVAGGGGDLFAALNASGELGPETSVAFRGRFTQGRASPYAFHRSLSEPEFRLDVERPSWDLRLGEIHAETQPVAGTIRYGRGAGASWMRGDVTADVFVAAPPGGTAAGSDGHIVLLGGHLEGQEGELGFTLFDQALRRVPGEGAERARSVGVNYTVAETPERRLRASLGIVRVATTSGREVTGPAGEIRYSLRREGASLATRARRVPARATGLLGNELYLGGRHRLSGNLSALGHGFLSSDPDPDREVDPSSRSLTAGLRYARSALRLTGLASYRELRHRRGSGDVARERTGSLRLALPLGPVDLEGSLELGHERVGDREGLSHRYRGGLRWFEKGRWASLGLSYHESRRFRSRFQADLQGGMRTDRVEVEGRLDLTHGPLSGTSVGGRTRISYDLPDGLAAVTGLERRHGGFGGRDLQVSFGLQKRLALPLPAPRRPVATGRVFEDRDADGAWDAGELGLAGVRLQVRFVEVETDERGDFEIHEEAVRGRTLRVIGASLPDGMMVLPQENMIADGRMSIPVVRTASLILDVFHDGNRNGRRDSHEESLGGGVVTLVHAHGRRRRLSIGEDGRARASSLAPGEYEVTLTTAPDGEVLAATRTLAVRLASGEALERAVGVPGTRREIRY